MKIEKIIDFPMIRQTYEFDCGTKCLQAVFAYYGVDIKEGDLINILKTNPSDGTRIQEIIKLSKKYGFNVECNKFMTVNILKEHLIQDEPVIMPIQAWSEDEAEDYAGNGNGHYVVAIGYGGNRIFFEDPSVNYVCYLSEEELMKRWHDKATDGKIYEQCGIVISGKKPVDLDNFIHLD